MVNGSEPKKQKTKNRANGEGTIFFDTNAKRWVGTIIIGWRPDGAPVRRKRTAKKRADVVALLKELQREHADSPLDVTKPQSVEDYLTSWLDDVKASRAAGTHFHYKNTIDNHVVPHIGRIQLNKLRPINIQRWLTKIGGIGPRARQNAYKILRRALNEAVRLRLITRNPTDGFETPKCQRKPIQPFNQEEVKAICEAFEESEWELFVLLAVTTGMRQGEILGLQWGDRDGDLLHIRRQQVEHSGEAKIEQPKTEAGRRTVPISPSVVNVFARLRSAALEEGRGDDEDFIFYGPYGGRMRRTNFRERHWIPALKALGIAYRSPHQMRHSYATLALAAGVPITEVSRILGHAKVSITHDFYAHAMPKDTEKARQFAAALVE